MNHAEIQNIAGNRVVLKRDGTVVAFSREKIRAAIANAFLKDENGNAYQHGENSLSKGEHDKVEGLTDQVCSAVDRKADATVHIEDIQDQVELALMRSGEHAVARAYILYREKQKSKRTPAGAQAPEGTPQIVLADGSPLNYSVVSRLKP